MLGAFEYLCLANCYGALLQRHCDTEKKQQFATNRELHQSAQAFIDGNRNTTRRAAGVMLLNVIADLGKVAGSWLRPADTHQPGYRRSISFLISSWSTNSPRPAASPFSTSCMNHSS